MNPGPGGRALPARRVAIVHDWLTGMRGGEKVLEAICELYPGATLFTLVRVPGSVSERIESHPIRTSFAQRLPRAARWYRHYLPLYPAAVETFDLDDYDLVLSSSHCAVKSVITRGDASHVCYCHSPMRYAWDQFGAYFGAEQVGEWPSRALRPVMAGLARWDASTAHRVDRFLANSQYVAGRIGRYYNRRSSVVYPPVDTDFYRPAAGRATNRSGALVVSALVPYKRIDVAIEASRLTGIPLRIVGQGPEEARLRASAAGASVEFLGWRTDEEIRELYRGAGAVLLPGTEDFGIVPVEAQACGTPVVAFAEGGARETVIDGITGALVNDRSAVAFADAVAGVAGGRLQSDAIRTNAERFSIAAFKANFQAAVDEARTQAPGDQVKRSQAPGDHVERGHAR
ncbi:MAG: glycosyltransferase [Acidobacteriota bacterium]|nr:glycosyltransferase [Acidobacteriota bacterium]